MNERQKNAKIIELVEGVLGGTVSMDTSMKNTPRWDSLKTLQIVMALDENGLSVPFERIADIKSMKDILEMAQSPEDV